MMPGGAFRLRYGEQLVDRENRLRFWCNVGITTGFTVIVGAYRFATGDWPVLTLCTAGVLLLLLRFLPKQSKRA